MKHSTTFICLLTIILLAACSGHSHKQQQAVLSLENGSSASAALPVDIQTQVDALVAPAGCSATLFYRLKKSFVQALSARLANGGKLVSVPPSGDSNIVHGLIVVDDGGAFSLRWSYRNIGDYDQGGTVGITDITPIAMHFGHAIGTDGLDGVIHDVTPPAGAVSISDVTPIAMNYGVNVTSYTVEESADEAGPFLSMGTVPLSAGSGADAGWLQLQFALPDATPRWLRVVPVDAGGTPGVPSDVLQFTGTGTLPEIMSVSPLAGASNASVTFQAVVNGTGPFTYDWQFGGAAAPDSSTEAMPAVTLCPLPGNYNCSVEVTSSVGSDMYDFVFTIGYPPGVNSAVPTSGLKGASVTFTADVIGTAPIAYDWDFAGGATPDTSTEESPLVTLSNSPAYYFPSLSVSNAYGTALYDFVLVVYSNTDPPVIANAGPTQVHAGDTVTFSATITGATPMAYSWTFGDACSPSASGNGTPTVTITNTLGTYPVSFQAINPNGVDTYNFDLTVIDANAYDEVEVNDDIAIANPLPAFPVAGWHCNLTELTDTQDCFSFNADIGDRVTVTMRMAGEKPWMGMSLFNSGASWLSNDHQASPTERTLDFTCGYADTYCITCVYNGTDSLTSGDYWLDITMTQRPLNEVEDNDDLGTANEIFFPLSDFYGSIGAGGYDGDSDDYFVFDVQPGDLVILGALSNSGAHSIKAELLNGAGIVLTDLTALNGLSWEVQPGDITPFYMHITPDVNSGLYILSGTIQPSTLWEQNVIDNTTSVAVGNYASILLLSDGYPGVIYQDAINLDVYFGHSDTTDGMSSWTLTPVDVGVQNVGNWVSGGIINNRPAAAYLKDDTDQVWFAMCPTENGAGSWNVSLVDADGRYDPSVAELGGFPAVAYEKETKDLWFGINADQYAAGAWNLYPVTADGQGAYYTSLITLGNGCPGISYNAYNRDEVRFATCDTPDGSGTWTVSTVKTDAAGSTSAVLVDGRPAVVYFGGDDEILWYSINSEQDGSGAWSHSQIMAGDLGYYDSLAVINGYPAVLYRLKGTGNVYYAVNQQVDGLGEWVIQPVLLNSGVRSNRALLYLDKPVCTFTKYIGASFYLGFAAPAVWP